MTLRYAAEKNPSVVSECITAVGELCTALLTAAQGMMVTGRYLVKPDEIVTLRYPREKFAILKNYRGRLVNAMPRCIMCRLCEKACPTNCISMDGETGADKKNIIHYFNIDMTICLYCGLCTEACPDTTKDKVTGDKCLTMQGGYEYSSDRKEALGFFFKASDQELAQGRKIAEERAAKAAAEKAAAAAAAAAAKAKAAVASSAPVIEVQKP
ncbi:MAG: 4Fe-4S dicluster domain-containing protein [Candidatus Hydrogenedentota bacterium]